MTSSHSPSSLNVWSGFVLGILAGFALSSGLIGVVIGYNMGGGKPLFGPSVIADQAPSIPGPPAAPAPAAAPVPPPVAVKVKAPDAKTDHILGNPNATVSVIEYSDFECPFCKRHSPTLKSLMQKYGNDVNIIYRHYPLAFHPSAQKAAEGSECAAELGGNDAFWKYHDALFALPKVSLTDLVPAAVSVGLNESAFQTCLDSGRHAKKVGDQMAEGASAGVRGTPGNFIVNNKTKDQTMLSGAVPAASFEAVISPILGK